MVESGPSGMAGSGARRTGYACPECGSADLRWEHGGSDSREVTEKIWVACGECGARRGPFKV